MNLTEDLPEEIIRQIVDELDPIEWNILRHVNKYFSGTIYRNCVDICLAACESNYINVFQWAIRAGYQSHQAVVHAAFFGRFDITKWASDNTVPSREERIEIIAAACRYGDLPLIEWLYDRGYGISTEAGKHAAYGGHIHVLDWLRKMKCPWNTGAYLECAKNEQTYGWIDVHSPSFW